MKIFRIKVVTIVRPADQIPVLHILMNILFVSGSLVAIRFITQKGYYRFLSKTLQAGLFLENWNWGGCGHCGGVGIDQCLGGVNMRKKTNLHLKIKKQKIFHCVGGVAS